MKAIRRAWETVQEYRRAYLALNLAYYGLVILGMIYVSTNPSAQSRRRLIRVLSKSIELALSPSRAAPNSASTPAITCEGTCTYRGSAPAAA